MDQILQMILEIVREQQRDAADLKDTMTKAEVVELTMSMMEQQGIDEYHEDLEADIYNRIQYLAPRLFQHEEQPEEPEIHMEKFSYRMRPTEEAILNNENLNLDYMIGNELQGLSSPITTDTTTLDYEQAYPHENPVSFSESSESSSLNSSDSTTPVLDSESISEQISAMNPQLSETFQDVFGQDVLNQSTIDEESLNQLVMAKYMELANSNSDNLQIDSASLASLVMQALQNTPTESEVTAKNMMEDNEEVDNLLKEIWESEATKEEAKPSTNIVPEQNLSSREDSFQPQNIKTKELESTPNQTARNDHSPAEYEIKDNPTNTVKAEPLSELTPGKETLNIIKKQNTVLHHGIEENSILSGFYNTKTYMAAFTDYLESLQTNQAVLTGFSSIDRILETGLHKGTYLVNSDCIDISSFCLQLADQIAKSGFPICYLLLHHSRYECMAKSLSRLTYELRGKEKAIPLSSLYKKQEKEKFSSLRTELQYYEENIASNLYFIESNWKDMNTLLSDIKILVQNFEQNIGQKPVFLLDNLSLCKAHEDIILKLENLCSDLGIILITSINYPAPNIQDSNFSCLSIELTDLPEQDSFTKREIILEAGNSLLLDISFVDGTSKLKKRCQLFHIPKFYYFESR